VIYLVLAGLLHRKLRTASSIAAMATALAVLAFAAAGVSRANLIATQTPDYVVIAPVNVWLQLPLASAARFTRLPGVQRVEYFDTHFALAPAPEHRDLGALITASDGYFSMSAERMMRVEPALQDRWRGEKQGLISDPSTAARLGWRPPQLVNLSWQNAVSGQTRVTPFEFLGTYSGLQPRTLVVHHDYVDQQMSEPERGLIFLLGVFKNGDADALTDQAIGRLSREMPDPAKAAPAREWLASIVEGELTTTQVLEKLTLVLIAITGGIVGAGMSMSLRQRRSEIATLRALGFSRTRVFLFALAESGLLSLAGYALGVLAPVAALSFLHRGVDLGTAFLADVVPGVRELSLAGMAAALLTLGISLWPAASASRHDVVSALQEG
jgi:putative ABC transport system permease protein